MNLFDYKKSKVAIPGRDWPDPEKDWPDPGQDWPDPG